MAAAEARAAWQRTAIAVLCRRMRKELQNWRAVPIQHHQSLSLIHLALILGVQQMILLQLLFLSIGILQTLTSPLTQDGGYSGSLILETRRISPMSILRT